MLSDILLVLQYFAPAIRHFGLSGRPQIDYAVHGGECDSAPS